MAISADPYTTYAEQLQRLGRRNVGINTAADLQSLCPYLSTQKATSLVNEMTKRILIIALPPGINEHYVHVCQLANRSISLLPSGPTNSTLYTKKALQYAKKTWPEKLLPTVSCQSFGKICIKDPERNSSGIRAFIYWTANTPSFVDVETWNNSLEAITQYALFALEVGAYNTVESAYFCSECGHLLAPLKHSSLPSLLPERIKEYAQEILSEGPFHEYPNRCTAHTTAQSS